MRLDFVLLVLLVTFTGCYCDITDDTTVSARSIYSNLRPVIEADSTPADTQSIHGLESLRKLHEKDAKHSENLPKDPSIVMQLERLRNDPVIASGLKSLKESPEAMKKLESLKSHPELLKSSDKLPDKKKVGKLRVYFSSEESRGRAIVGISLVAALVGIFGTVALVEAL